MPFLQPPLAVFHSWSLSNPSPPTVHSGTFVQFSFLYFWAPQSDLWSGRVHYRNRFNMKYVWYIKDLQDRLTVAACKIGRGGIQKGHLYAAEPRISQKSEAWSSPQRLCESQAGNRWVCAGSLETDVQRWWWKLELHQSRPETSFFCPLVFHPDYWLVPLSARVGLCLQCLIVK